MVRTTPHQIWWGVVFLCPWVKISSMGNFFGKIIIALLIAGVGIYGYLEYKNYQNNQSPDESNPTDKRVVEIAPGVEAEIEGNLVPRISADALKSAKLPDFDRIPKAPKEMSQEIGDKFISKLNASIEAVKADPTSYGDWIDIGIYRKILDDYEGAKEIWAFLVKAAPDVATAYVNLGNLYAYYLHDNKKAEQLFLDGIDVAPRWKESYDRAVDFYVVVTKEPEKARALLVKYSAKYPDMKSYLDSLALKI